MVWNLSVRYDEREVMDKVAHESIVGDCGPSEWLLVCTGEKRWVDVSGRWRGGGRAMDGARRTREYCMFSIDFCVTFPNGRGCDELISQRKT